MAGTQALKKRKRAQSITQALVSGATSDIVPFWSPAVQQTATQLWIPCLITPNVNATPAQWFETAVSDSQSKKAVCDYDARQLDRWLLTTERGVSQVDDKSLITKKPRTGVDPPASSVKTRKIRVYPADEHQRKILPQWFGTARWIFNQCLDHVKKDLAKPTRSGGLREAVLNDGNYKNTTNAWVLETPRDVRAGAYQDLIDAYSSNFAKQRVNPAHKFEVKCRSKKVAQERIYIDKRRYSRGVIYPSKFGNMPLCSTEPLPDKLEHDAHLIRTRLGHYYLCITVSQHRIEKQDPLSLDALRVAAIDPGVRTPHTLYDPSGKLMEFGKNSVGRLYRLCYYLDQLRSKIDLLPKEKSSHRKRWRMRKAWHRASLRIHNLVEEYHRQVVHYIVSHYDVILLPALETSSLINRKTRKLTSKAARAMVTWSHYRFRQRLLWKCHTHSCKVVVCGEAYTSKTCGRCGWLHQTLGRAKVFTCGQCGLIIDRDANGARNILLKNASRFGFRVDAALGLTPASVVSAAKDAWPSVASSFSNMK